MLNKTDLRHIEFISVNGFDRMDYNNQRNFMWCMVDVATAEDKGQRYDWTNFPYEGNATLALADILPRAGTDKLRSMAMKLTNIGIKTKLMELIAA